MILYGVGTGNDGGSTNHISDGGGGRVVLKKGPWTAAEDEILAAYVRENGEGNWNALQKHTCLARCGKSCRLRWANHLRPNLKKGSFTGDEERLIIQLHAQLGNKWARMAAQLPGRTDNEIKNYWNTRLKRLQRQGLPLYPPDIIPNHQLHPHPQQHHHQQQQQQHQHQHQQMYFHPHSSQPNTPSSSPLPSPTPVNANPSSSFTFHTTNASTANFLHPLSPHTPTTPQTPSQLSSRPPPQPLSSPLSSPLNNQYPTLPLFNNSNNNTNFTFPRPPPLLQPPSSLLARRYNNSNTPLNYTNCVSTAPFSPVSRDSYTSFLTSPYSSSAVPTTQTATYHNANNNYSSFSLNPSSSSYPTTTSSPSFLLSQYTPNSSSTSFSTNPVYSMKQKLPSNQIPQIGAFNSVTNFTNNEKQDSIGLHRRSISCSLLEDVMEEAEALDGGGGGRPPKRRQLTASPLNNHHHNNNNSDNDFFSVTFGQYDSSENMCSLQDLKSKEESLEINTMQEDIAKFLDWGCDSGEISNGQSSAVTDDNLVRDVHQFTSIIPADSTAAANDQHDKNNNNNNFSWDDLDSVS